MTIDEGLNRVCPRPRRGLPHRMKRQTLVLPEDIPQSCIDILNERAGKEHSRQGSVVQALAEVLTEWERLKDTCG